MVEEEHSFSGQYGSLMENGSVILLVLVDVGWFPDVRGSCVLEVQGWWSHGTRNWPMECVLEFSESAGRQAG